MRSFISIIVPVYNVEKYLVACLESLVNQTYQNIEVVLVDDGSTDHSSVICEEYVQRDSRIHLYYQINGGVSSARNLGLEKANGEYVVFVDSDDYVLSNYVETLYGLLSNNNADIAMIALNYKLESNAQASNKNVKIATPNNKDEISMNSEETLNHIFDDDLYLGYVCNKIFKRKFIILYNIRFEESVKLWEDILFCCQYITNINRAIYSSEKLYIYNIRGESATNLNDFKKENTKLIAIEKIMTINNNDKFHNKLKSLYASMAIQVIVSTLYFNGIYDPVLIHCNLQKAKPFLKTKGVSLKIKVYYLVLNTAPKFSFMIYQNLKKLNDLKPNFNKRTSY